MAQIFQPLPFRGNDSLIYQLDIQADYSYDDCERLPENQEIQNEEVASSSDGTGETTHPFGVYGAFSNMTHLYCKRVQVFYFQFSLRHRPLTFAVRDRLPRFHTSGLYWPVASPRECDCRDEKFAAGLSRGNEYHRETCGRERKARSFTYFN